MQGGAGAPPCISVPITVDLCFDSACAGGAGNTGSRRKKKEKR